MALTETAERRTVQAQVRHAHVSAYKVREVLDLVRGKSVDEAEVTLAFTDRGPAAIVAKCLQSAVANAEHNHDIPGEELFVWSCYADEGPTLKRWRPRARGRATRIRKRTCHITVILSRHTPEELEAIESSEAARGTGGGRRRDAAEERRRRVAKSRGEADETPADDEADVDDEAEATEPDTDVAPEAEAAEPAAGPTADELVADNTKDELLALADEAGASVAKSSNKAKIAAAIVAARDGEDA